MDDPRPARRAGRGAGRTTATPQFGTITAEDAKRPARRWAPATTCPGNYLHRRRQGAALAEPERSLPERVTNVVPLQLSMGAYNALQQSDAHNYWEFNYTTNWIHPLYELPFTGGFPDRSRDRARRHLSGRRDRPAASRSSRAIASAEREPSREAVAFGDNPDLPRDPDKFDADDDAQREFRERFIPSGIAREVFLNVFERLASFEPDRARPERRLVDGYKAAIALVDTNHDGIISAAEGDIDTCNANCFPRLRARTARSATARACSCRRRRTIASP